MWTLWNTRYRNRSKGKLFCILYGNVRYPMVTRDPRRKIPPESCPRQCLLPLVHGMDASLTAERTCFSRQSCHEGQQPQPSSNKWYFEISCIFCNMIHCGNIHEYVITYNQTGFHCLDFPFPVFEIKRLRMVSATWRRDTGQLKVQRFVRMILVSWDQQHGLV